MRTAFDIALKSTDNEELQKRVIFETMKWLTEKTDVLNETPTVLHTTVQRLACKITSNLDPFKFLKQSSNEIAMNVLPILEEN